MYRGGGELQHLAVSFERITVCEHLEKLRSNFDSCGLILTLIIIAILLEIRP